jgi:2-oxoglutarate dehydrogenase E2 component (dihydrolipoamide succinyltransferase)
MSEVTIPVLNSTDDSYVLVEWLVPEGAGVSAGDVLALIETSKAVTELVAADSGCLSHRISALSTCRPGQVAGDLSAVSSGGPAPPGSQPASAGPQAGAGPASAPAPGGSAEVPAPGGSAEVVVTRPAQALMDAHGLTADAVAGLGKGLIRRSDVAALITGAGSAVGPAGGLASGPLSLPAHQQAVARAVSQSHASIPSAFTVIKVDAAELLRRQELAGRQAAGFIGIPEFVIKAVAGTSADFPVCFAGIGDDLTVTAAGSIDIGVTIDVGTGLYVPVIRAADTLDFAAIAARMMYFRTRAMRGQLSERDLAGPRLILSLHQARGIMLALPIIYPGQACTLSLAAVDQELRLGPSGQVTQHSYFYLGMCYDHRVINGREAAAFLSAVRDRLQAPAVPQGTAGAASAGLPGQVRT